MRHNRDCCSLTEWFISVFFRLSVMNASVPMFSPWYTTFSTAVHRRTFARSLALPTFQVAEDFALPAATASSSLRFTTALLAAEHFRLLSPGVESPATGGYVIYDDLPPSTRDVSIH